MSLKKAPRPSKLQDLKYYCHAKMMLATSLTSFGMQRKIGMSETNSLTTCCARSVPRTSTLMPAVNGSRHMQLYVSSSIPLQQNEGPNPP